MSHDAFCKQDLALALARALDGESHIPREVPSQAASVRLQHGNSDANGIFDPTELGGKLLRELDRLGYTVERRG